MMNNKDDESIKQVLVQFCANRQAHQDMACHEYGRIFLQDIWARLSACDCSMVDVTRYRTQAVDLVLCELFVACGLDECCALFAVGGYGRQELSPYSDVDILMMYQDESLLCKERISEFVASLWDIGITPAIAIRGVTDAKEALTDITVATAMLESRYLMGCSDLKDVPQTLVRQVWCVEDFFRAKMAEVKARYISYNATEYNLEPNLKNAPGGLRDLHIILWLFRFYFEDVHELDDLVTLGLVGCDEIVALENAKQYLWQLRHHLQIMNQKAEDRLLFGYQKELALRMGFCANGNAAPELMMYQYYRHAMTVAALSELLCDVFYHRYVVNCVEIDTVCETGGADAQFGLMRVNYESDVRQLIYAKDTNGLLDSPYLVFELFLKMGQWGVKYIEPTTLQIIRKASQKIKSYHESDEGIKALFLQNLQEQNYLFHRLRLMKRHGVLGRYLPDFGRVMGLMQYDLYHRYTVDAHTLLLVRILHRIWQQSDKFGLVSGVYHQIVRKDLLTIAAIFHDLAKGLNGDHSELGADLVLDFCVAHGLSVDDGEFVAWLVRQHLTMSHTSQKKDVADSLVISEFANLTKDITHLNHLYVLTVADMSATNHELYNSWRATLLKQLYVFTHRKLSDSDHDSTETILSNRRHNAYKLLSHYPKEQIDTLWQRLGNRYLLSHSGEIIAWHTDEILRHEIKGDGTPLIAISEHNALVMDAAQILVYAPNRKNLFAKTVAILDGDGLSVLAANILTDKQNFALDSYVVVDRVQGKNLLRDEVRMAALIQTLQTELQNSRPFVPKIRHQSKSVQEKLRFFEVPTQISFKQHPTKSEHSVTIITKDQQGLLAKIGKVFSDLNVWVHGARIMTMGERAEDVFYVSDKDNVSLSDERLALLKQTLIVELA